MISQRRGMTTPNKVALGFLLLSVFALVEFLDFECESCAAAYPLVEDLREEYSDELTFVSRSFPLPEQRIEDAIGQ